MLDDAEFVAFANEHVVAVVGHSGAAGGKEGHKPLERKDPKTGETRPGCPLYPGITCEEHVKVREEVGSPPEGVAKIEVPSTAPSTFLVGPDGTVERLENGSMASAGSVQEAVLAFQKKFEAKPLSAKRYEEVRKALAEGDAGVEKGAFKAALAAYAKLEKDAKRLPPGLVARVRARLEAAETKAAERFAALRDGDAEPAQKWKDVKSLRAELSTRFTTGPLPVVAAIDAWLKETAAAAAAPK